METTYPNSESADSGPDSPSAIDTDELTYDNDRRPDEAEDDAEIADLRRVNAQLKAENDALFRKIRSSKTHTEEGIAQEIVEALRKLAVPNERRNHPTTMLENRLGVLLKNYPITWV